MNYLVLAMIVQDLSIGNIRNRGKTQKSKLNCCYRFSYRIKKEEITWWLVIDWKFEKNFKLSNAPKFVLKDSFNFYSKGFGKMLEVLWQ